MHERYGAVRGNGLDDLRIGGLILGLSRVINDPDALDLTGNGSVG